MTERQWSKQDDGDLKRMMRECRSIQGSRSHPRAERRGRGRPPEITALGSKLT
jgi:hypothetical protein